MNATSAMLYSVPRGGRLPASLASLLLGLVLATGLRAEPPGEEAEQQCKQILYAIHENTEATYREMRKMPGDEADAYLRQYVEASLRRYVNLDAMTRKAFTRDWAAIEAAGLQDAAGYGALYELRVNLHSTFEAYERGSRLKLLRIRSRDPEQVWISGLLGPSSPGAGRLPFAFTAMFSHDGERWLLEDLVFLNAAMSAFVRSNVEHRIDQLGLEAALAEYAALVGE